MNLTPSAPTNRKNEQRAALRALVVVASVIQFISNGDEDVMNIELHYCWLIL
jgi:hypothetical protein